MAEQVVMKQIFQTNKENLSHERASVRLMAEVLDRREQSQQEKGVPWPV